MKKLLILLLSFILLFTGFTYATDSEEDKTKEEINAELYGVKDNTAPELYDVQNKSNSENTEIQDNIKFKKYLTREEIFVDLFSNLEVLESYKYIDLYYKDVKEWTALYRALQKAVYLNLFQNLSIRISPNKKMSQYYFMVIAENILDKDYGTDKELKTLKWKYVTPELLQELLDIIKKNKEISSKDEKGIDMLVDIYSTILEEYYYRWDVDKNKVIYSAIAGMLTKLDDKFTRFFPPELSKKFLTQVNSSYEWLGIYTEMDNKGYFVIKDIIPNSPAYREWLQVNDIIRKVDWLKIKWMTDKEILELLKGEIATRVKLEILRWVNIFTVDIVREKIIIPTVNAKTLRDNTYYIDINSFGEHTYSEFKNQLNILKTKKEVKQVIFDFRDNPWGYLEQAIKMLDAIIPKNEDILVIEYKTSEYKVQSKWTWLLDLDKYEVYILVNERSASASEVMVGVIKDYYPNVKIFGKTTYGKWSVQSFKIYDDGSSFKFTVAKWLIWKNRIGIDKIWIIPDVEIELNKELLEKGIDTQLNKILDL